MKEWCWTLKILLEGYRLKLLSCKHVLPFKGKEEWLWWHSLEPTCEASSHRDFFSGLATKWNLPCWISQVLGTSHTLFFSFCFCPFGIRISITLILCLSHQCTLGTDNLFSTSTSPEMERNFASEWIIPRVSLIHDLHYLDDEMWNFWADDIKLRFWTWFDAVMGWNSGCFGIRYVFFT